MNDSKTKKTLHPVISYLILSGIIIVLSGLFYLLEIGQEVYKINATTLEFSTELVNVYNLFSIEGLKYIFTSTVSNFVSFAPLSSLIIILIGIGIMEKSGFLKTAFTLLTKKMKKNTLTFFIVFLSVISSVMGDISYIVMLPLSALIFKYGKRNPTIGIIASFAGLTCGAGLSMIFTSVDSSLLTQSLIAAQVIDKGYRIASIGAIFIMGVAVVLVSLLLTWITEKFTAPKFAKVENANEEEKELTHREIKGLVVALMAAGIYLLVFIYNIIPGLPFSGKLLDDTQLLYVDKLFSYDSFFSDGFVFIITFFFLILGLFYGLGAKTIKNNKDFVDGLGYSLDSIGKTIVLIFFASLFISIFKKSNIGTVFVAFLASLFRSVNFQGIPLIILLFLVSILATLLVPTSITKWTVLSPIAVPVFMNAGITPEFAQVIFRFGESVSMGLTPLMAYFVIYIAIMNKYSKEEESIGILEAIKYIVPYAVVTFIVLILLLVLWYVVGIPLGINGFTVL